MAQLIDGKAIAKKVRAEVAEGAARLKASRGIAPGLSVIRVGEDPASKIYVGSKRKAAAEAGFDAAEHHFPESASQAEILAEVKALEADHAVHGILIQLPLPKHLDADALIGALPPEKDVDGLHPVNAGKLLLGRPGPKACTPHGIMRLLDEIGVDPLRKRAVVVGRSNIVGKPMALMLLARHATVTICHSKSDLEAEVPRADILVAAVGVPELIRGSWIKEGATVIDVGQNRSESGKLLGDVAFAEAAERAAWITPVPGGVGPMTVAMLLKNTLEAAERAG